VLCGCGFRGSGGKRDAGSLTRDNQESLEVVRITGRICERFGERCNQLPARSVWAPPATLGALQISECEMQIAIKEAEVLEEQWQVNACSNPPSYWQADVTRELHRLHATRQGDLFA
jgi:hypothetical protein